jgi:arylsulfatase A-like enzyme
VASLFTGLHPCEHGAFEGIKRSRERLTTTDALPPDVPTLAQTLSSAGWRCGAFINNGQLGEFAGLARGFGAYLPAAGKADRLIGSFLQWLDQEPSRPFFAYLHFLEAHWPYRPRRRHVAQFGGDRDASRFRDFSARDYGRLRQAISRQEQHLSDDVLEDMVRMYDAAVRRLDGKVKLVLKALQQRGLDQETVLLVTADHGEEFLDHGLIGHGQSLYEELIHVPLVMCVPRGPRGQRRGEPVSHVDVAATLLACAGLPLPPERRDLLADEHAEGAVCSELRVGRRYSQAIRSGPWKLHQRRHFSDAQACGAWTRFDDTGWPAPLATCELYDLQSDPAERRDLASDPQWKPVRDRLTAELDSWWDERRSRRLAASGCEVAIDERVVERLRELGYVD